MQIRFGQRSYDDPMETLSKLKQEGTLEDYKDQFDTLALKVHGLPDGHKLSCFLGGLRDDIRVRVRMFNPKSLIDAYSLARLQDECLVTGRRNVRLSWNSNQVHQTGQGWSTKLPVGFARSNRPPNTTQNNAPGQGRPGFVPQTGIGPPGRGEAHPNQALVPVQKITPAQMDERRRKCLCYSCDSKWTRGHVCAAPKLFLIEALEEGEETQGKMEAAGEEDPREFFLEEFPEISLNAITGTPSPKTMRIVGFFRLHQVIILIDSGSTHNFVDAKLAATLGIQPQPQEGIQV